MLRTTENDIISSLRLGNDSRATDAILKQPELAKTYSDNIGWTLLMLAVTTGCYHAAATLIKNGADVNAHDGDGFTVLMIASLRPNQRCLELLMQHPDINVFAKNDARERASDIAKKAENTDAFAKLIALENAKSMGAQNNAQVEKLRHDCTSYFFNIPKDILQFILAPMVLNQQSGKITPTTPRATNINSNNSRGI